MPTSTLRSLLAAEVVQRTAFFKQCLRQSAPPAVPAADAAADGHGHETRTLATLASAVAAPAPEISPAPPDPHVR